MTDFNGKVQGNFVDDDDIVRTGRVMIELNGYGFMQVPIPTGLKQAWDDLRGESSTNLQEIRSKTSQAVSSADSASKSAAAAKSSESNAASSKNVAASSASAAAGSASAAKTSETNASNSAAAAKSSEQAAAGSATEAKTSASAAKQSESNAASSKSAAAGSAAEAKTSASAAKQDADRAAAARTATENIAKSTSWNGDQLTVNGKTSPHLKGDKGDKGDPGDVTNVTWDVVKNKPATFPPEKHKHTVADVSDLNNKFANRDMSSQATGHHLVMRDASGRAQFSDPSSGADAATKAYVDAQDAKQLTASEVEAQGASPAAGKVVRRDSAGQVLVPTTAGGSNTAVSRSELTSGLAGKVDKSYVDNAADKVRSFAASRAVVKQVTTPPSSYEPGVLYVIPE